MQCTKCKMILDIANFSYKNADKKIYYLHCNTCREKILSDTNKKIREKEYYKKTKKENAIECACGVKYIAFRDFHILRHASSKIHIKYMLDQGRVQDSV
jgi:hypothetical protein